MNEEGKKDSDAEDNNEVKDKNDETLLYLNIRVFHNIFYLCENLMNTQD